MSATLPVSGKPYGTAAVCRVSRLARSGIVAASPRATATARSSPRRWDAMWGTDLTTTFTGEGQAAVFIAVDHCSAECVGIHAHARATRFEALELIRQGVRRYLGGFAKGIAQGLNVRHDHGSQ